MNDSFEDQLRRQTLRKCPETWRDEILEAIPRTSPQPENENENTRGVACWLLGILKQKQSLALGAVWFIILLLRLTEPTVPEASQTTAQNNTTEAGLLLVAVLEDRFFERSKPLTEAETKTPAQPTRIERPRSQLKPLTDAQSSEA